MRLHIAPVWVNAFRLQLRDLVLHLLDKSYWYCKSECQLFNSPGSSHASVSSAYFVWSPRHRTLVSCGHQDAASAAGRAPSLRWSPGQENSSSASSAGRMASSLASSAAAAGWSSSSSDFAGHFSSVWGRWEQIGPFPASAGTNCLWSRVNSLPGKDVTEILSAYHWLT